MAYIDPAIVIDNGTYTCQAGFAGDDAPRAVFPSVVGRVKHPVIVARMDQKIEPYVGDEAKAKRGILILNNPIERGMITNWDDMERMWHHTFYYELRVDPQEQPVLLTEPPLNPKINRERLVQVMFETFNTPAIYLANQAVLSLYAAGKTTGIVVDSGESITHIVPIHEGYSLPHAVRSTNIGGQHITQRLVHLMSKRGYSFMTTSDKEIVIDIKEKLCFVAHDFDSEIQQDSTDSSIEAFYELPSSYGFKISNERFRSTEPLFSPDMIEIDGCGVHENVFDSIMKCDVELQPEICLNIVLSGATTLFPGFAERLSNELVDLFPISTKIKVIAPPERKYSTWIGGSVLSSLPTFMPLWFSKDEYDEVGPSAIHKRIL